MFRSFQIIIREFRRSLLKLLHIHDLVTSQGYILYPRVFPTLERAHKDGRATMTR